MLFVMAVAQEAGHCDFGHENSFLFSLQIVSNEVEESFMFLAVTYSLDGDVFRISIPSAIEMIPPATKCGFHFSD